MVKGICFPSIRITSSKALRWDIIWTCIYTCNFCGPSWLGFFWKIPWSLEVNWPSSFHLFVKDGWNVFFRCFQLLLPSFNLDQLKMRSKGSCCIDDLLLAMLFFFFFLLLLDASSLRERSNWKFYPITTSTFRKPNKCVIWGAGWVVIAIYRERLSQIQYTGILNF